MNFSRWARSSFLIFFPMARLSGGVRADALYYDIVPNQRILYCYEMYADGTRISVSTATIELSANATGTTLTWTEQGVYLDGIDSTEAPKLRIGGTNELLDGLADYLEPR